MSLSLSRLSFIMLLLKNYTCHSGSIRTNMSTNDPNLVESHIPSSTVRVVVFALLALLLFSQECLKQNFFSRNTRARWPRRSRSRSFTPTARRSCWRCPTRSPRSSTRTSRLSRWDHLLSQSPPAALLCTARGMLKGSWTHTTESTQHRFFSMLGFQCMCTDRSNLNVEIEIMSPYHSVQMRC